MRIDVFTIFPDYLDGAARSVALVGQAREPGLLDVRVHDPRECDDAIAHRTVDDAPFGGGAGMVMMPEPLFAAVEAVEPPRPLLLLVGERPPLRPDVRAERWPSGRRVLAAVRPLRGRRPAGRRPLCDGELSVGDYVLAGGEAAALVVIEAVTRLRARRDGQRRVGGRGVVRRRPARVPAVHPARPSSGAGRCPRCCAPATTPASRAGGGPQALRRTRDRRPDLIAAGR